MTITSSYKCLNLLRLSFPNQAFLNLKSVIMMFSYVLYATLALINTVMAADNTEICLSNPEATIRAGSVATAMLVQYSLA